MEAAERNVVRIAAVFCVLTAVLYGLLIFFWMPQGQLAKYPAAAAQYLRGELTGERLVDFSPLYLRLHIVAQQVSHRPVVLISVMHILCSALSVSILFLLLARYFRLWIAITGTAAFLLDHSLIEYLQAFEPEPVLMMLMLLFAWLVTTGSARRHLLAGILLGLAVWTRPNFLPVAAVVPFYFYFNRGGKRILKSAAVFLTPVVILLIALWIRNTSILGYFSPFVMNPGTAYFEGNNPSSWGFSSIYPPLVDEVAKMHPEEADYQHATYRLIARRATGKPLTVPEVNSYWSGLAIHYLQDHPGHAIKLLGRKVFHFFHSYQWHDITNAFWNEQWLSSHYFPCVPFAVISALAAVGLITGIARWREFLLHYAIFLAQLLFVVIIYVSARQRVSVLWVFIFFACAALEFASAGRRRMLLAGAMALILAVVLQMRTDLMTEETRLWLSIRRSNALLAESYRLRAQDQLAEAAAASAASLASAPFYAATRRP
ncbi:MAG TPA: glycosyltransferase family 39 protein, partial [Acidobacteriota bacterium]|nr:glycosyltransferase family 39 protein [Acidobacteriota bacterium]